MDEHEKLWVRKERVGNVPPVKPETPGKLGFVLAYKLQENIWSGARDWSYLLRFCPLAFGGHPLQATDTEIAGFAEVGYALDTEGARILKKLSITHPRFPERVRCRKAECSDFIDRLKAHMAQAAKYRLDFKGQPGEGVKWDSVKGWCQYQHK